MVNAEELSNIGPPDTFLVTQDEKKISCHKSILIQESHYFKAMFSSNFAEKDQKEIKLQGVDGCILQKVIAMVYRQFDTADYDLALELIETATMLQFPSIQEKCTRILQEGINTDNAIDLLLLSDLLGIKTLEKHSKSFILYYFSLLANDLEKFSKLPKRLLLLIISHPHLHCLEETCLVNVIDSWVINTHVDKNLPISTDSILDLFCHVRFGTFSQNQLESIFSLPSIQLSEILSEIVQLMLCKKNGKELRACSCHCHDSQEPATINRNVCPHCIIHCSSEDQPVNKEKICCIPSPCFRASGKKEVSVSSKRARIEEDETQLFRPPHLVHLVDQLLSSAKRTLPSVPCVVGHVLIQNEKHSGVDDKLKPNCGPVLLAYNMQAKELHPLVQLRKVREGPVEASGYKVCAVGKDVYIIGGEYLLGHSNWQKSVWKYDTLGNMWSVEASLQSPRRHHSLCVVDHYIYLIGGFGKHRIVLDSVERYDTVQGSWKRCSSIKTPLYSSACCYYEGFIYVFSHQVLAYNIQSDEWRPVSFKNKSVHSKTVFSQALPVAEQGIFLTSSMSKNLYLLDLACPSEPQLQLVGEFQNTVLNSCYIESEKCIVAFSTVVSDSDIPEETIHVIEIFDVAKKKFFISWKQTSGNSQIQNFGAENSLGCFSLLHYL